MLTEAQRHQLYNELTQVLSTEGAATLMEVVGSVTIAELATKSDLRDLRAATRTDSADLRSDLKTEMADLRSDLKTDIAELRAEMAELKHDLTRTFATLLFVSQGVLVSIVGLLVAFA